MIPVDQDEFGDKKGNCFSACVASILEIPLAEVPHFCALFPDTVWFIKFAEWLTAHRLGVCSWEAKNCPEDARAEWERGALDYARLCCRKVFWIGSGPNINGHAHSTVWLCDKMVHDPNPIHGRSGLRHLDSQIFIIDPCPNFVRGTSTESEPSYG